MYDCGLVLEGGGMRGVYTSGVLDYFMEQGLEFSSVYGVSAGALGGANYVSRQQKRGVVTFIKYKHDERYAGIQHLLKTGDYFNSEFVYGEIPQKLNPVDYDAFTSNPTRLYVVVANVETGKAEYIHLTDLRTQMDYLRASASLPFLSAPVEIDGKLYLDGGTCDSIPLAKSQEDGNKKNVVVLTQHRSYRKGFNKAMPAARVLYHNYPQFVQAMADRHIMYNRQTQYAYDQQKLGNTFIIAPNRPVDLGRMEKDASKMWLWYTIGREDAKASYEKMMEFLNK